MAEIYAVVSRTADHRPGVDADFETELTRTTVHFHNKVEYDIFIDEMKSEFTDESETTDLFTVELFNKEGYIRGYDLADFKYDEEDLCYEPYKKIEYDDLFDYEVIQTHAEYDELERLKNEFMKDCEDA